MSTSPRRVHFVLSTHWDREWYQTFQQFRFRLVKLMDRVLEGWTPASPGSHADDAVAAAETSRGGPMTVRDRARLMALSSRRYRA